MNPAWYYSLESTASRNHQNHVLAVDSGMQLRDGVLSPKSSPSGDPLSRQTAPDPRPPELLHMTSRPPHTRKTAGSAPSRGGACSPPSSFLGRRGEGGAALAPESSLITLTPPPCAPSFLDRPTPFATPSPSGTPPDAQGVSVPPQVSHYAYLGVAVCGIDACVHRDPLRDAAPW